MKTLLSQSKHNASMPANDLRVLIHACPPRMWYVDQFLVPSLRSRGVEPRIWNDEAGLGCLEICMAAFAAVEGDGDTWHIQDDVLLCRDFVRRAEDFPAGEVVYGFACEYFLDDPDLHGTVYVPDAWHSFQCVRIPDAWARECAEWYYSGAWQRESDNPELEILKIANKGDDTFFREFLLCRHGEGTVINAKPNLAEHVDLLLGGSVLSQYRDYRAVAHWWDDNDLTAQLRAELKARRLGAWAPQN